MKKGLMAVAVTGAVLAGGVLAGVLSHDAQAAPLAGDGNFALDLVGQLTSVASPFITPVVGNSGIQGALLPVLFTGQGVLADIQGIEGVDGFLGDALQPMLGIVVPAAAPFVVGLVTLDPELIATGGIAAGGAVVSELVPVLLAFGGNGLLNGGLPGSGLLGGGLPGLDLLGGALGGGLPGLDLLGGALGGGLPGLDLLGGVLGGGLPGLDLVGGALGGGLPGLDLLGGVLGGGLLTP